MTDVRQLGSGPGRWSDRPVTSHAMRPRPARSGIFRRSGPWAKEWHSDMFRLATAGSVDGGKSTPSIHGVSQ
jgi:hypothetical protein